MVNANEWLEENYPKEGVCLIDDAYKNKGKTRSKITQLSVKQKELSGTLDVSEFVNLAELYCWENRLTDLILPNSDKLKKLGCGSNQLNKLDLTKQINLVDFDCQNNQLTQLILPPSNQLIMITVTDNLLTAFNYATLNPNTLTKLLLNNNNLATTNLEVFTNLVKLTILKIGNDNKWIKAGQRGNQFFGSLESLKNCTKLEWLSIPSTEIKSDLEYLPSTLNYIEYNDKLKEELFLYGHNLTLWQAAHPNLMSQAGQQSIKLANYNLTLKKMINTPWFLQKALKLNVGKLNYQKQFNYSSFLLHDFHPFSWENINFLENKFSGEQSLDDQSDLALDDQSDLNDQLKTSQSLPLRLYNLTTNLVQNSEELSDNTNYLALSYCWGTDWEIESQSYGQFYSTKLTKLGRKALNKVQATYQFLQQQSSDFPDHIWIDNFCINQADLAEKNQEVAKQRNYYSNAIATLIAIDAKIGNKINISNEVKFVRNIISKIIQSPWFNRCWTFQEGVLSKQTIFMFDDYLVDGRRLALAWGGHSSPYDKVPSTFITPLGWSYLNNFDQNASLNLGEALVAVNHRAQTVPIDRIYAILGLLPYGDQITVNYKETNDYSLTELEEKLLELINQAYLYNPKEIVSYLGKRHPDHWWLPMINKNVSAQIEDALNEDDRGNQYFLSQIRQVTKQGIQLRGYYTLLADATKIVEIDRRDYENNIRQYRTIQFKLNKKTEPITIKWTNEFYYSEKKKPEELFINMINHQIIRKADNLKKYQALTSGDTLVSRIEQININI